MMLRFTPPPYPAPTRGEGSAFPSRVAPPLPLCGEGLGVGGNAPAGDTE